MPGKTLSRSSAPRGKVELHAPHASVENLSPYEGMKLTASRRMSSGRTGLASQSSPPGTGPPLGSAPRSYRPRIMFCKGVSLEAA